MGPSYQRLVEILNEVVDLQRARAVLEWDQQTYMPPGGAEARAEQLATLARVIHRTLVSPEVGRLLEGLARDLEHADPDSVEAAVVRVARREFQRMAKLPGSLVAELARVTSLAHHAWVRARSARSFELFRPHLARILELTAAKAEHLGYPEEPYDALLDLYEPETRTAEVAELFGHLRGALLPLVRAITQAPQVDTSPLQHRFAADRQWAFTLELLRAIGFDTDRGRQDRSAHPFTTAFAPGDVRLTTRIDEANLAGGLFASLHEGGHALYEQGIPDAFRRLPIGDGASLGVHESQSRLWENVVGRSRPFWTFFLPRLATYFPAELGGVEVEAFYRAVNRVEPGPIRVEADEVTYNLHILLRFELERALLRGDLPVADLPAAWAAKLEAYLGVTPPDDAAGVLQDVHWSAGLMGYFPTYTLGNLLAVQLYRQALAEHPELPGEFARGEFGTLLGWLRERVHVHGAKYTPRELVQRVTGQPLSAEPFLDYLRAKYGEIYGLPAS